MDVRELQAFYASPLGRQARRHVARALARLDLPVGDGVEVVALGYGPPYLKAWHKGGVALAAMPARQGVTPWPGRDDNRAVLVEETALPLADSTVDVMVLAHALEFADRPEAMLREVWRVLAAEGRAVIIAPNRRGMWARFDTTPFGHGRPYSPRQLENLLRQAMFEPHGRAAALFAPPLAGKLARRVAAAVERAGARAWPGFAGVVVIEAVKRVYAMPPALPSSEEIGELAPAGPGLPRTPVS